MPSRSRVSQARPDQSTRPRRSRGAIASYGEGRSCAEFDCATVLSRYNESSLCWSHAGTRDRQHDAASVQRRALRR